MDALALPIAAADAGFFDHTFLYIAAGLLVALALVVSFLGLRREGFPNDGQTKGLAAVAVVLVICTGIGAVESARFEQAERRLHNQEAAKEAEAEAEGKAEDLAPLTEGEAAEPGTDTGEASSPQEGPGGEAGIAGQALFVDNGCGDCHTLADAGSTGQVGPDLDEVLPGQDADRIRTSIVDPEADISEGFPEGVMPAIYGDQFTEVEIDTLVAYLGEVAGN